MAPLCLTFAFTFLSRLSSTCPVLSSTCPVLSFYDPLTVNPSLFIAKSNTARLSIPFAASSFRKILRDLHATSASLLSPIVRLFRLYRVFTFRHVNVRFAFTRRLARALCADPFADLFSASPHIYSRNRLSKAPLGLKTTCVQGLLQALTLYFSV
ncbi:hypothetical protein P692DRAFT_20747745 [Suillus brevipes Sb2]|nr:hypothetical protein P692DRAFT_20747745 [Suillus brevipes Sb2]